MSDETRNAFISHIHENDEGLHKLKDLLKKHGLTVRDYSINASNPNNAKSREYIKREMLAPRIRQAGTIIVYISPETKSSEWVNWEIEYAHKKNKRIVGVWEYGCAECEIPSALEKYGDALVGWNGNRIIDAIHEKINRFEFPQGVEFDSRQIKRYDCKKGRIL